MCCPPLLQGELLQALALSVAVLRGEKEQLGEEQQRCGALGVSMEALVQERCKPNEKDKYRMFIGDLDKIVNLLLSLSGRLARVESALAALEREADTEDSGVERVGDVTRVYKHKQATHVNITLVH